MVACLRYLKQNKKESNIFLKIANLNSKKCTFKILCAGDLLTLEN
jgi:hypothetical protein